MISLDAERLTRRLMALAERTDALPISIRAVAFRMRGSFVVYVSPWLDSRELREACLELEAVLRLGGRVAISRPRRDN